MSRFSFLEDESELYAYFDCQIKAHEWTRKYDLVLKYQSNYQLIYLTEMFIPVIANIIHDYNPNIITVQIYFSRDSKHYSVQLLAKDEIVDGEKYTFDMWYSYDKESTLSIPGYCGIMCNVFDSHFQNLNFNIIPFFNHYIDHQQLPLKKLTLPTLRFYEFHTKHTNKKKWYGVSSNTITYTIKTKHGTYPNFLSFDSKKKFCTIIDILYCILHSIEKYIRLSKKSVPS